MARRENRAAQASLPAQGVTLSVRVLQLLRGAVAGVMLLSACQCMAQATPQNQRQTAIALEQQGDFTAAEQAWREILKVHATQAEPYAHLGLLEARQEHYHQAIALYRKALALDPSMPSLRLNLGLACFKAGEMKEAIGIFLPLYKSLHATSPERQRLAILLGMANYGRGAYAEAVPYLKVAAAADAQNLPLRLSLAHSCLWSKQYPCVLDTYHQILTLNANSAEADMLAGEALDEMKDHAGAIEQFRAADKANPNQPDVHFGLGYLLWTQRRYDDAVSEFQLELVNNPDHQQALLYMGDAQMQMSHFDIAQTLLEKLTQTSPKVPLGHLDLGIVYADEGRKDDALREMSKAVQLDPDDVNGHWRLGRLYLSMGKKEAGKMELEKAHRITKSADDALINKISGGSPTTKTPIQ